MKKITLITLGLMLSIASYASHLSGGEIRYEFNGTNYDVFLTLYKVCEPNSASIGTTQTIRFSSNAVGQNFAKTLTNPVFDTVKINCPSAVNSCYSTTGTVPGYIKATFKTTVTIPTPAKDWKIYWTSCCRIAGILNLSKSGSHYMETTLDNSAVLNSNPYIANSPSYYMSAGTPITVPLQVVDPEGDSVHLELTAPLEGLNQPAAYVTGYSATSPFGTGGTCQINNANKTLTMSSSTVGKFALAFNVKEYRNNKLVGTYIREFVVSVFPSSSSPVTFPAPANTNNFSVYTCPGQTNNSITLNFTDPTVTDSVMLDVTTPTLPGWTFNVTSTTGSPTATTTVTWSTPSNLNPATIPHFYINVRARDNQCPRSVSDYSVIVRTRQCLADSVWPGDANGDFTVNIYDALAIAIAHGQTGPSRPNSNLTWTAQACPNWTNVFVTNNTNMKHADCNGNGTVNNGDLGAVNANFSKSHPKGARNKTTGTNELYLDMSGVNFAKGSTVSIPIKLGNQTQQVNNAYGMSTRLSISGITLTSPPTITTANSSWLDNSGTSVNFVYPVSNNVIEWAHARTDQTNVSGNGTVGILSFKVPDNAKVLDDVTFSFSNSSLINKDGIITQDFNDPDVVTKVLWPESINSVEGMFNYMSIVPNPSGNNAVLNISLKEKATLNIAVTDITGRVVWTSNENMPSGAQHIVLPAESLSNGVYLVKVSSESISGATTMKWIKN